MFRIDLAMLEGITVSIVKLRSIEEMDRFAQLPLVVWVGEESRGDGW